MRIKDLILILTAAAPFALAAQSLETDFINPPDQAKPIIIWQWMDGVVSARGITADLEAYKGAGIGGDDQIFRQG